MKHATVRDLRYHFVEIEASLGRGEQVEIRKRRKVIARLVPIRSESDTYPDFAQVRRRIFAGKTASSTGTQLVSSERGRD